MVQIHKIDLYHGLSITRDSGDKQGHPSNITHCLIFNHTFPDNKTVNSQMKPGIHFTIILNVNVECFVAWERPDLVIRDDVFWTPLDVIIWCNVLTTGKCSKFQLCKQGA